jgi:hypothetical protein
MRSVKFDKDVPMLPPEKRGGWGAFAGMKVGESFLGERNDYEAAWQHAKKHGWRLRRLTQRDGQIRVWRIA